MSASKRNQSCHCGSGKKLKKCCDSAEVHNALKEAQEEAQRRWVEQRSAQALEEAKAAVAAPRYRRNPMLAVSMMAALAMSSNGSAI